MSLINIIRSGDVFGVFHKIWSLISGHLPAPVSELVEKVASTEGELLWGFAKDALSRAAQGQSVQQIAEAEWDAVKDQVPSLAKKDFMDFLGMISRASP